MERRKTTGLEVASVLDGESCLHRASIAFPTLLHPISLLLVDPSSALVALAEHGPLRKNKMGVAAALTKHAESYRKVFSSLEAVPISNCSKAWDGGFRQACIAIHAVLGDDLLTVMGAAASSGGRRRNSTPGAGWLEAWSATASPLSSPSWELPPPPTTPGIASTGQQPGSVLGISRTDSTRTTISQHTEPGSDRPPSVSSPPPVPPLAPRPPSATARRDLLAPAVTPGTPLLTPSTHTMSSSSLESQNAVLPPPPPPQAPQLQPSMPQLSQGPSQTGAGNPELGRDAEGTGEVEEVKEEGGLQWTHIQDNFTLIAHATHYRSGTWDRVDREAEGDEAQSMQGTIHSMSNTGMWWTLPWPSSHSRRNKERTSLLIQRLPEWLPSRQLASSAGRSPAETLGELKQLLHHILRISEPSAPSLPMEQGLSFALRTLLKKAHLFQRHDGDSASIPVSEALGAGMRLLSSFARSGSDLASADEPGWSLRKGIGKVPRGWMLSTTAPGTVISRLLGWFSGLFAEQREPTTASTAESSGPSNPKSQRYEADSDIDIAAEPSVNISPAHCDAALEGIVLLGEELHVDGTLEPFQSGFDEEAEEKDESGAHETKDAGSEPGLSAIGGKPKEQDLEKLLLNIKHQIVKRPLRLDLPNTTRDLTLTMWLNLSREPSLACCPASSAEAVMSALNTLAEAVNPSKDATSPSSRVLQASAHVLALQPAEWDPILSQYKQTQLSFSIGDPVWALFGAKRGGRQWYEGVVADVNPDGTYSVQYNDGDRENGVIPRHVRPVEWKPEGSQSFVVWIDATAHLRAGLVTKTDTQTTVVEVQTPGRLPLQQWTHVAVVLRRGWMELFINGSFIAASSASTKFRNKSVFLFPSMHLHLASQEAKNEIQGRSLASTRPVPHVALPLNIPEGTISEEAEEDGLATAPATLVREHLSQRGQSSQQPFSPSYQHVSYVDLNSPANPTPALPAPARRHHHGSIDPTLAALLTPPRTSIPRRINRVSGWGFSGMAGEHANEENDSDAGMRNGRTSDRLPWLALSPRQPRSERPSRHASDWGSLQSRALITSRHGGQGGHEDTSSSTALFDDLSVTRAVERELLGKAPSSSLGGIVTGIGVYCSPLTRDMISSDLLGYRTLIQHDMPLQEAQVPQPDPGWLTCGSLGGLGPAWSTLLAWFRSQYLLQQMISRRGIMRRRSSVSSKERLGKQEEVDKPRGPSAAHHEPQHPSGPVEEEEGSSESENVQEVVGAGHVDHDHMSDSDGEGDTATQEHGDSSSVASDGTEAEDHLLEGDLEDDLPTPMSAYPLVMTPVPTAENGLVHLPTRIDPYMSYSDVASTFPQSRRAFRILEVSIRPCN